MNIRAKTAFITTSLNISLTVLKFFLFAITGSQAILAEAWHSFSDIATSLLVLFAVSKQDVNSPSNDQPLMKDREVIASFIIGIILLILSIILFIQVIKGESVSIEKAGLAGIIFIVFSFFSYVISIFETQMGENENSISLMADGNHARADMAASLLTGFALLLYQTGIDLDRPVATLIAIMIFTYAIDTFVNIFRKKTIDQQKRFSTITAIGIAIQRYFYDLVNSSSQKHSSLLQKGIIVFCCGGIVFLYGLTGAYTVNHTQQACVERLGKQLKPVGPGFHVGWPWPFERVRIHDITIIREINIGNVSINKTRPLLWTKKHGAEEPFISGDQYFVYPYVSIHYRVNDIQNYVYQNSDPVALLNNIAYQTLTQLLTTETFDHITGSHRSKLLSTMHTILQSRLKSFKTGIEIISVHFKDIHPPISVADAFERVVASYQYKQNQINQALGYENKTVPNARGKAAKTLTEAKTWQLEREQTAKASFIRFNAIHPHTKEQKQVAKKQVYFQAMKDSLENRSLFVIDQSIEQPDLWLKGVTEKR